MLKLLDLQNKKSEIVKLPMKWPNFPFYSLRMCLMCGDNKFTIFVLGA